MSRAARIKETIRFTIIFILVCYFGLIALVGTPRVQQRLSALVSKELSGFFQTNVQVGNIDLGFLNRIIIQNVRIDGRNGEKMFHISRLSAKVDLSFLFHQKIRISSAQLFGLNVSLTRDNPEAPLNCQFIIDALTPENKTQARRPIDLRINSVLIRRGQFSYDIKSVPETKGVFNAGHIAINNLSATISLKAFQSDSLNLQLRRMSFSEQSGFQLKRFRFKVTANQREICLNDLFMGLPRSAVSIDTLAISGQDLNKPAAVSDNLKYGGRIRACVTPADLSAFAPVLSNFTDSVSMNLRFHGKGKQINIPYFSLNGANGGLELSATGMADGNTAPLRPYFFGNVKKASLTETGIEWLIKNFKGSGTQVPPILKRLGYVYFKGDLSGYPTQLTAHGLFQTDPGDINANITMFTDTVSGLKTYSGKVSADDFGLGLLLGKEDKLGNASFNLELQDFKYRNKLPESYIKGTVTSLEYNKYVYKEILLDGNFKPGGFNGHVSLNDPNGNIEINGSFVTGQQTPDFNLKAVMRNLRPNKLRLTEKYEDTNVSLNLTADFSGHSIDDMQGKITLDSLNINSPEDSEKSYFMPYLQVLAGPSGNTEKSVRIESPFLHGEVLGNYSYRTVLTSIRKIISQHIPSLMSQKEKDAETNNNFRFRLSVDNSDFFNKALQIPFELQMPATFSGQLNDSLHNIRINGYLPQFTYQGKYYESGTLLCNGDTDRLQCQLRASLLMKKGAMFNISLQTQARNDKLSTTLFWGNNTRQTFSGKIEAVTAFLKNPSTNELETNIDIHPSNVILNDTVWKMHPTNLSIKKDSIEIRHFLFEHGNQYISANGRIGKNNVDSCLVDMKNIRLNYLMDIIQFRSVSFNGNVSGRICLRNLMTDPDIQARLNADNFSLNEALLGQAAIKGSWDKELGGIRLTADIRRDANCSTFVDGYISPKQKGLDLHIRAGGTPLSFLQPFVRKIFSDVNGEAYGNVRLFGPFAQLDLEGSAKARMGMKVNILNTRFEAETDSVHISSGIFRFKNVRLKDSKGHTGLAHGTLTHTKMKDMHYRFSFSTDNMLVYDTKAGSPEFPFYGHIYATGNVSIQGGDNQLNVDGTVRADAQTSFSYILKAAAEATNSSFITFVDHTPRRQQLDVNAEIYHYLNSQDKDEDNEDQADVHINLQIEPTEQASMKIIMDPAAGDNISAHGTGNLRINFYNKGNFQIFGTYNITEGIYKMSLQNVIRKDFILQPGGTVTFSGNPRSADLNIQAVYTVNSASLNDLIADASSSKGNVRVNCLMNLSGNLTSPELKFDLELPTVSEEDRELVRSLTSTEEQMNTQIIYLLSVGKFYTYDIAAENATQTDATSSLAFSTLSGQLNNMLSQVINSQNWNVGTNLTTGEKGWSDVEAEAILSGRLLNNRLIINGNFGYRENTLQNTNFVGDFEAIWLLTPNGEFRLRGYNQTNDRYFTKSTLTTQGIGLMYKKDFTNWRELFDWFLRRKRNRTTRQAEEEERKAALQNQPAAQQKREQE